MTQAIISPYIFELGEKVIREHIEQKTVKGILNPPPVGTRIRATLGETVLVGTVAQLTDFPMFYLHIDSGKSSYSHTLSISVWVGAGWTFELLEDDEPDAA